MQKIAFEKNEKICFAFKGTYTAFREDVSKVSIHLHTYGTCTGLLISVRSVATNSYQK